MFKPYLSILTAIVILALGSYYLTSGNMVNPVGANRQITLPKTYLVNPRTTSYSKDGALTEVLEARTATLYQSKEESLLDSPTLYSHNDSGDTWSASADIGRYQLDRKSLTLSNNVILTNDTHNVQLASQRMKFDFKKNTATSKVPVTITHGASSTRADGMIADLNKQTVALEPNVESDYVQPDT